MAIGQLHNERQYTERVGSGDSRGGNNGSEDAIISWHSAWLKYSPASHYDSVDSSGCYLSA